MVGNLEGLLEWLVWEGNNEDVWVDCAVGFALDLEADTLALGVPGVALIPSLVLAVVEKPFSWDCDTGFADEELVVGLEIEELAEDTDLTLDAIGLIEELIVDDGFKVDVLALIEELAGDCGLTLAVVALDSPGEELVLLLVFADEEVEDRLLGRATLELRLVVGVVTVDVGMDNSAGVFVVTVKLIPADVGATAVTKVLITGVVVVGVGAAVAAHD